MLVWWWIVCEQCVWVCTLLCVSVQAECFIWRCDQVPVWGAADSGAHPQWPQSWYRWWRRDLWPPDGARLWWPAGGAGERCRVTLRSDKTHSQLNTISDHTFYISLFKIVFSFFTVCTLYTCVVVLYFTYSEQHFIFAVLFLCRIWL